MIDRAEQMREAAAYKAEEFEHLAEERNWRDGAKQAHSLATAIRALPLPPADLPQPVNAEALEAEVADLRRELAAIYDALPPAEPNLLANRIAQLRAKKAPTNPLADPKVQALVEAATPYVSPVQNADFGRQVRQHEALVAALRGLTVEGV